MRKHSPPPIFLRPLFILPLLITSFWLVGLQSSSEADGGNLRVTEDKNHTASLTQAGGCCGDNEDADAKPHLLAASYYSVRDELTATLMLNNKGPKLIDVQLSLFNKAGERQDIAPLVAEPLSFKEINLREFIAEGSSFEEGSLQVFHRGKDLVLGVQVKLVDEARSLIFDEKLAELATEFSSNELESVWWLPSRECETKSVLTNTTDNALTNACAA